MSDERKRENEEEKLKDFFHNVIGIKSEAVLEVLAENSEICKLKAKTTFERALFSALNRVLLKN